MKIRNVFGTRFRGRMGKDLIASSWKGRPYLKEYAVPENPRTERQQENRHRFGGARETWRRLTDEERAAYDRRAADERISGWNLFVREHMRGVVPRPKPPEAQATAAAPENPPPADPSAAKPEEPPPAGVEPTA